VGTGSNRKTFLIALGSCTSVETELGVMSPELHSRLPGECVKKGGLASSFPHSHAPRGNAVWARCAPGGQKAGLKTRTTFLYGTAPPVAAKTL